MEFDYIELVDLAAVLKDGIESLFPEQVWVKAEISSLNHKPNGHCYLDLSQSDRGGVCVKVRATIWASKWNYIDQYFKSVTGSSLESGMEVLFLSRINFHPVYGLSLDIDDVNPEFTVGAAMKKKQMTIERLTKEGLMDLQERLQLPDLPYSLAVISAPGAAGYGDFCHHIEDNEYGFVFNLKLFEAVMQGDQAPSSIISAIDEITSSGVGYDAILIMRGGGSDLDLACFDDYDLAAAIARCPIPVFTAIGHDKDFHVADMVAHTFVKTPTALAALFIDCYVAEDQRISSLENRLKLAFSNRFSTLFSALELVERRICYAASSAIDSALSRLSNLETRIIAADPRRILEKGYVLALDGRGVKLTSASGTKVGEKFQILFPDGTVRGEVTEVVLDNDDDK